MSDQTLARKGRADTRRWESCSKYKSRLRHQVGTDIYRSKVPDPARPGSDLSKTVRARNWTEARALHEQRLVQGRTGDLPDNSKATLDDLAERRWETLEGLVASGERAPTTLEADKTLYAKHLASLGRLRLDKIQTGHVSRLLADLRRAGYAPGTITRVYSVLRAILNLDRRGTAILAGLNKTERPSAPIPQTPSRCLTDEQVSDLLHFSLPSTKILNAIYAFTGVRQAEGLGITWDDLDLTSGMLKVSAQLSRKTKQRVPVKAARRRLGDTSARSTCTPTWSRCSSGTRSSSSRRVWPGPVTTSLARPKACRSTTATLFAISRSLPSARA
jgi:integrase